MMGRTMIERINRAAVTLYYRAYIRWLALQWMAQINLGDEVVHKGRVRVVSNGVIPTRWTLLDPYEEFIPRSECRKHWTLANMLRSYRSGVDFYEGYWLSIWVNKGIEQWVRNCNIWPRPFK